MNDIDQYRLNRIDELIEENDKLRTKVGMFQLKVNRLRRNVGKLMNDEQ